jgi:hypothetical protein
VCSFFRKPEFVQIDGNATGFLCETLPEFQDILFSFIRLRVAREFQFSKAGISDLGPSVASAIHDRVSAQSFGKPASEVANNVFVIGIGGHIRSNNEDVAGSLKGFDYAFGEKGSGMV